MCVSDDCVTWSFSAGPCIKQVRRQNGTIWAAQLPVLRGAYHRGRERRSPCPRLLDSRRAGAALLQAAGSFAGTRYPPIVTRRSACTVLAAQRPVQSLPIIPISSHITLQPTLLCENNYRFCSSALRRWYWEFFFNKSSRQYSTLAGT